MPSARKRAPGCAGDGRQGALIAARSCLRGLSRRGRSCALRPCSSSGAAEPPALPRRSLIDRFAAARARILPAAGHLVDCRPGPPLRFLLADAALFITFFDMFRLAFLLLRVFRFVTSRHHYTPYSLNHLSVLQNRGDGSLVPSRQPPCRHVFSAGICSDPAFVLAVADRASCPTSTGRSSCASFAPAWQRNGDPRRVMRKRQLRPCPIAVTPIASAGNPRRRVTRTHGS